MNDPTYTEHSSIETHGFQITDSTVRGQRLIWVGHYGEGRWMTHAEFREFAQALAKFVQELAQ